MEKQTKNVITREFREKELGFYNTAHIRSTLVLCAGLSLLFVPLTVLAVCGVCWAFTAVLLEIIISVLLGSVLSAPVWINLLCLIPKLKERKLLQNGDFVIAVCEMSYKEKKTVRRHTENVLHFVGFDGASVASTTFDLASQGDEFYVVHYKGLTGIELLYPLNLYELQ